MRHLRALRVPMSIAACLAVVAVVAQAKQASVTATLAVFKITRDKDGAEQFTPVEAAKPGDLLEYRLTYANPTEQAVTGLQATLPLPEGLAYVAGSARPDDVRASLDGKAFAPVPLRRKVKDAAGETRTVDVPTSEYRALRWKIATLAAGGSTRLTARAKVLETAD